MSKRKPRPVRRSLDRSLKKDRIAHAVHHAVCTVTNSDGRTHCRLYATTALIVAQTVTGHHYAVQAGSAQVATGAVDDEGFELAIGYLVDGDTVNGIPGGLAHGEFHCWLVKIPPGSVPGSAVTIDPERQEVVDLSLRHFPQLAVRTGVPWTRTDLPDFYWGSWAGLRRLGIQYKADLEATHLVNSSAPVAIREAAVIAVEQLGRRKAS